MQHKSLLKQHLAISGENFFFLLIALLAFILSWPFLLTLNYGRVIVTLLFIGVFFASIYSVGRKNKFVYSILLTLVILSITLRIIVHFYQTPFFMITAALMNVTCLTFVAIVILEHILIGRKITLNEIYGAICVYLLIGLIWTIMFILTHLLNPQAFYISPDAAHYTRELSQFLYFSFVTLTSAGCCEIYPISPMARGLVFLEVIISQIYLIVLIGWMVAALGKLRSKKK
jgi:voltage-gated potassium channel